jgi:hypothetical protein
MPDDLNHRLPVEIAVEREMMRLDVEDLTL